jgi:hypothetical protein
LLFRQDGHSASALEITFTQKAGLTAGVKRSRSPFGPRA